MNEESLSQHTQHHGKHDIEYDSTRSSLPHQLSGVVLMDPDSDSLWRRGLLRRGSTMLIPPMNEQS